jgi:hypothetical protein
MRPVVAGRTYYVLSVVVPIFFIWTMLSASVTCDVRVLRSLPSTASSALEELASAVPPSIRGPEIYYDGHHYISTNMSGLRDDEGSLDEGATSSKRKLHSK